MTVMIKKPTIQISRCQRIYFLFILPKCSTDHMHLEIISSYFLYLSLCVPSDSILIDNDIIISKDKPFLSRSKPDEFVKLLLACTNYVVR